MARAGNSGGGYEPGIYFELRHKGAVQNPKQWLAPWNADSGQPAPRPITRRTLTLGIVFGVALGIVLDRAAVMPSPDLQSLQRAKQQIHEHYLGGIDGSVLERGAIRGMIGSLDDYSEVLTLEAYERLLKESQGGFVGVGLEITLEDGFFTVLSTLDNRRRRPKTYVPAISSKP